MSPLLNDVSLEAPWVTNCWLLYKGKKESYWSKCRRLVFRNAKCWLRYLGLGAFGGANRLYVLDGGVNKSNQPVECMSTLRNPSLIQWIALIHNKFIVSRLFPKHVWPVHIVAFRAAFRRLDKIVHFLLCSFPLVSNKGSLCCVKAQVLCNLLTFYMYISVLLDYLCGSYLNQMD